MTLVVMAVGTMKVMRALVGVIMMMVVWRKVVVKVKVKKVVVEGRMTVVGMMKVVMMAIMIDGGWLRGSRLVDEVGGVAYDDEGGCYGGGDDDDEGVVGV